MMIINKVRIYIGFISVFPGVVTHISKNHIMHVFISVYRFEYFYILHIKIL
jgi:hypothetical protein